MILHEYFRSSAAFRVRIAFNLKGLNPERQYVHLANGEQRNPDFLAINPQGLVPYLIDGDLSLGQSMAIIEYLDETHPAPPLMPADAKGRAWVRAFAQMIACEIHPLNNLRVLNYLTGQLKHSEDEKNAWYRHWIHEGFVALEQVLQKRAQPGRYCWGDQPTLADICLIPQVANAQRFKCRLEAFPTIMEINARALALPAFDAAQPSKQPDFPKA
jgi:maleylpyruvate isomerase